MSALHGRRLYVLCCGLLAAGPARAFAQSGSPPSATVRQSLDDAWWTGPILAAGAGTLPPGHLLIEPYLYDVVTAHSNEFGSLTYVIYGVANGLSVGVIPTAGFTSVSGAPSSSGVGMGDISALAQYRLTQFHAGSSVPTTSVVVQETFPTGKYDQLGGRPSDGFGGGAYTTTVAFYSQTYLWMPNGRILRTRLDISQAFSSNVNVEGVSVYGTGAGFQGYAEPGSSLFVDAAFEYSVTRSWVVALDLPFRYTANTAVTGSISQGGTGAGGGPPNIRVNSGASSTFGFAPAIEYNLSSSLGVLVGTRVLLASRNAPGSLTPVLAINFVH